MHAIGALDMALHDLRGKALGKPCYEMLGGAVKQSITPYASLQPEVSSFPSIGNRLWSGRCVPRRWDFVLRRLRLPLAGRTSTKD